jgi:hypothetical protein
MTTDFIRRCTCPCYNHLYILNFVQYGFSTPDTNIYVHTVQQNFCSLVEVYRRFEGTYWLNLHGRIIISKKHRNKQATEWFSCLVSASLILEDGDSMLLRNVHEPLPKQTASYPRCRCQILKPKMAASLFSFIQARVHTRFKLSVQFSLIYFDTLPIVLRMRVCVTVVLRQSFAFYATGGSSFVLKHPTNRADRIDACVSLVSLYATRNTCRTGVRTVGCKWGKPLC